MAANKPSPLDEASARLSQAFDRLETAVISSVETLQADDASHILQELKEENARIADENAKLSNQLQDLQQEHIGLQEVASNVADSIDAQVEQLDLVMLAQA